MSRIEFEEERYTTRPVRHKKPGGIIGLLIRRGIARDVKQANLILIGTFIVLLIGIVLLNLGRVPATTEDGPDPSELTPLSSP